jgi:hypothetical protein
MTATGSLRHEGSDWTAGLGPFVCEPLMIRPPGFYPSAPPSSVDSLANADDRAEAVVRICAICIWEISRLTDEPEIVWPLTDRMAQSSTDIGPEASVLIQRYITVVERKPASINQATKIYNERNQMGAV